ncbi:GTPase-activating protein [Psittacicella hinzii]|uniref:Uncharacterized protein n=1 Tax=Psittacicella hinzii TaxID=2028575 RepID=A0A3A1YRY1_9GAMM|nr:GTPase-activating protein [Psittacicella hinzii]RIY39690.1 hypothetical protein CKF58_01715 [Psittacicella hinzii]
MSQRRKLTRVEANELSWALKKKKKHAGRAAGSRSNPNLTSKAAATAQTQKTSAPKEKKAIPIYIPGKDKPLMNTELAVVSSAKKETAKTTKDHEDLVFHAGTFVSATALQQEKAKARAQAQREERKANQANAKAASKASNFNLESDEEFNVAKLGKAQLRMLERYNVEPGKEAEFFAQQAAAKKAKKATRQAENSPNMAEQEDRRIKTRDYKAGRNADYVRTQAAAEKSISAKRKQKEQLSGEELLDLWENTQW